MDYKEKHSVASQHEKLLEESNHGTILGRNVTRLRKQAKITKHRFALMIGVGRPFLDRIENGTADPRLSIIDKLSEALDTTPQDLLTNKEAPAESSTTTPSGHARLY